MNKLPDPYDLYNQQNNLHLFPINHYDVYIDSLTKKPYLKQINSRIGANYICSYFSFTCCTVHNHLQRLNHDFCEGLCTVGYLKTHCSCICCTCVVRFHHCSLCCLPCFSCCFFPCKFYEATDEKKRDILITEIAYTSRYTKERFYYKWNDVPKETMEFIKKRN